MRHSHTSIHATANAAIVRHFDAQGDYEEFVSINIADVRTDFTMWEHGTVTLRAKANEHNQGTLFLTPDHALHLAHAIIAALDEAKKPEVAA